MDPNATLRRWRQALKDHDWEEARAAEADLRAWVRRGGAAPTLKMMEHEKTAIGLRSKRNPCKANPRKRKRPHVWRGNPKGPKLTAERVRINRQGYDSRGTYWGVGAPLYRVSSDDGFTDIHVRAATAAEAKNKVRGNPCEAKPRANPNFHFPRTARGRPKKARAWNLGFYDTKGGFLGKTSLSTSRDDAKAAAMGYVGARRDGKVIHKVILTGPK